MRLQAKSRWYYASRILDAADIWDKESREAVANPDYHSKDLACAFRVLKYAPNGNLLNRKNRTALLTHPEYRSFCVILHFLSNNHASALITQASVEFFQSREKLAALAGVIQLLNSEILKACFEDIKNHKKPVDFAGVLSLFNTQDSGFNLSEEDKDGIKKHPDLNALFDALKSLRDGGIFIETRSAVIGFSGDPRVLAEVYLTFKKGELTPKKIKSYSDDQTLKEKPANFTRRTYRKSSLVTLFPFREKGQAFIFRNGVNLRYSNGCSF